jgi:hypothetical protein
MQEDFELLLNTQWALDLRRRRANRSASFLQQRALGPSLVVVVREWG